MDRQYDFAALEALLKKRSFKALREALLELNEVDIAEFLGLLNGEEAVLAFRTLPKGVAADVFAELEPEMQQLIVAAATDAELADRKSTRLNSSHPTTSRMPSSA